MAYDSTSGFINQRRLGTADSPYIDIEEALVIDNSGRATLREIPSEYHRVAVTGNNEDWFESNKISIGMNEYRVDYKNRQVQFNISQAGKQLIFKYKGTGGIYSPADSIYVQADGTKITKTLQDLAESAEIVDQALQGILEELPANRELKDIRVSADGTTHLNAKDRLDADYSKLDEKIDLNQNETSNKIGILNGLATQEKANLVGAINENTAQLAQSVEEVRDFNLFPQSPRPPKQGVMNRSAKIIKRVDDEEFMIIQKTNKGYLKYILNTKNGNNGSSDYGVNHELFRIKHVSHLPDCYLYYDIFDNKINGELSVHHEPSSERNYAENRLLSNSRVNDEGNISSKENGLGVGTYLLNANKTIEFDIPSVSSGKMNLLYLSSDSSSRKVTIMVNNVVVKEFDARQGKAETTGNSFAVVEFPVPIKVSTPYDQRFILKITNNDENERQFYVNALNFCKLEDWLNDRMYVTDFKAIGSNRSPFIDNNGASDYAFQDETGKFFGSFHGGEVRDYGRASWSLEGHEYDDNRNSMEVFEDIPSGEWRILSDLKLQMRTRLIDKANMAIMYDFNIDGTMEMSFSLYDSSIKFISAYTALTCTHVNFEYVGYPWIAKLPPPVQNQVHIELPVNEGMITQYSAADMEELTIRYTKFNDVYNNRKSAIRNHVNYRKFYYGPVQGQTSNPRLLKNLTFSKGLDFIIR